MGGIGRVGVTYLRIQPLRLYLNVALKLASIFRAKFRLKYRIPSLIVTDRSRMVGPPVLETHSISDGVCRREIRILQQGGPVVTFSFDVNNTFGVLI
jgi:hypothetical protein